jgi:serine/threonine protein kinase
MDTIIAKRIESELVGREVGDWQIEGRLDQGKSAVVFRASSSGGAAAVKVFDPEMVELYGKKAQIARIERELQLKGKHHPNLVKILGGGECSKSGYLFVAMEFIDAPNLASVLSAAPTDRIWSLISQVASAARFLEELGLAHRDIKPGNIAVTPDFQRAILLDLGVLRPFGVSGLTDDEQRKFVGTLQYSPPEFLVREEQDSIEGWRAVTFYQLGAVLHDLIMKVPIFADQSEPYGLLARAVERVNPKIDNSSVPADLVVLAASCLQKDPNLRLDLVSWDDFDPPELRGVAKADDPVSRIRRRCAMARQTSSQGKEISIEQIERSSQRTVEKLQAFLQTSVRQECIGSELFPLLEVHDLAPERSNQGGIKIQFRPSSDHALSDVLSIFVHLELLSENSEAVRISYTAAISQNPLEEPIPAIPSMEQLFKGVFNQAAVSERLKTMLYSMFDRAQQAKCNPTDSVTTVWLSMPMQEEVWE